LTLKDGRVLVKNPKTVRGQPEDPMDTDEVIAKAKELIVPVLGKGQSTHLIEVLETIDRMDDVRKLRPLLQLQMSDSTN
jgi:hypothetical protein